MLFNQHVLDRIAAGEVTLAFRRWRRPTVKPGSSLRTAAGVLAIDSLEPVALETITPREAQRAGFESLAALKGDLAKAREGTLYRIAFRLAGADPRVALRQSARLGRGQAAELRAALDRFDAGSRRGPWSRRTLDLIGARAGITAAEIAADLGLEKQDLKRRVRKLKELGLTESLPSGYRLSPRGRALLAKLPRSEGR
jgi:hypothetical protein